MTPIKRGISFILEKRLSKKDTPKSQATMRLRCAVTWNGVRVREYLGYLINPDKWNAESQRCEARSVHDKTPARVINNDIDEFEAKVDAVFLKFEERDIMPTKEMMLAELKPTETSENADMPAKGSLLTAFDSYMKECAALGLWSPKTETMRFSLRAALKKMGAGMSLEQFDNLGVAGIVAYYASLPDIRKGEGVTNDTIKKNLSAIKTFLRWAMDRGLISESRILKQKVKLKSNKIPVVFLEWDEVMRLLAMDFGKNGKTLDDARDVFCFCCFTSLRYSDVKRLRWADVGTDAISVTTQKTSDSITIELNQYSRAILERRKQVPSDDGLVFHVPSAPKYNAKIKRMCRMCGIDSPISIVYYKGNQRIDVVRPKYEVVGSHTARRTFICNALSLGIAPNIVMKWTGHSDYNAMRPYIDIADTAKRNAMAAFDKG